MTFFLTTGFSHVIFFTITGVTLKFCKMCMQWIPLRLISEQKICCIIKCLQMLKCYNREKYDFFEQLHVIFKYEKHEIWAYHFSVQRWNVILRQYEIIKRKITIKLMKLLHEKFCGNIWTNPHSSNAFFPQKIYSKHCYFNVALLVL